MYSCIMFQNEGTIMLCYLAIALMTVKIFVLTSFSQQSILYATGHRPFTDGSTNQLASK